MDGKMSMAQNKPLQFTTIDWSVLDDCDMRLVESSLDIARHCVLRHTSVWWWTLELHQIRMKKRRREIRLNPLNFQQRLRSADAHTLQMTPKWIIAAFFCVSFDRREICSFLDGYNNVVYERGCWSWRAAQHAKRWGHNSDDNDLRQTFSIASQSSHETHKFVNSSSTWFHFFSRVVFSLGVPAIV